MNAESMKKTTIKKVNISFMKSTHPYPHYSCLPIDFSKHKKDSQIWEKENRDENSFETDVKTNRTEKNCQIECHEE